MDSRAPAVVTTTEYAIPQRRDLLMLQVMSTNVSLMNEVKELKARNSELEARLNHVNGVIENMLEIGTYDLSSSPKLDTGMPTRIAC